MAKSNFYKLEVELKTHPMTLEPLYHCVLWHGKNMPLLGQSISCWGENPKDCIFVCLDAFEKEFGEIK